MKYKCPECETEYKFGKQSFECCPICYFEHTNYPREVELQPIPETGKTLTDEFSSPMQCVIPEGVCKQLKTLSLWFKGANADVLVKKEQAHIFGEMFENLAACGGGK